MQIDVHLLADIDLDRALLGQLVDHLEDAGVDPLGVVAGQALLGDHVRLDVDELQGEADLRPALERGDGLGAGEKYGRSFSSISTRTWSRWMSPRTTIGSFQARRRYWPSRTLSWRTSPSIGARTISRSRLVLIESTWLWRELDGGPGDLDILLPGAGEDALQVGLGLGISGLGGEEGVAVLVEVAGGDHVARRRAAGCGPWRPRRRSSGPRPPRAAARAGGTSSGRGAISSLCSWAFAEASSAIRTSSLGLEVPIVGPEQRHARLDLLALLDEDLLTTPGIFTPIGMFSRRRLDQPRAGDHLDPVGPGRRLDDRLRAGGGTCCAWITRVDREHQAGHRQDGKTIFREHELNDLRDGDSDGPVTIGPTDGPVRRPRRIAPRPATIWPSSMWAIRSPNWKTRLSWVTTTTARSGRTAASRSSSMTVRPVSWSRAAVGSSQTRRRGSWTSARAIATRCIWPPESWLGQALELLPHAQALQDLAGAPDRPLARPAGDHQRDRRVLGRGQGRQQVVLLEDEADVPRAEARPRAVAHRRQRLRRRSRPRPRRCRGYPR